MKHRFFALAAFFIAVAYPVFGQATANFTASVTIVQPVGITTTENMDFASLDAQTGGEVILTPNNERIATGGVKLAEGGRVSAATFEVTGQPGYTFALSLPKEEHILSNGSEQIIIKDFMEGQSGNILEGGKKNISIGATVAVQSKQMPGVYRSTKPLAVTVNYN